VSSVDTEYTAIVTYWRANCPVVEARRSYRHLGGELFDRPKIVLSATPTLTTLQALVWIALSIQGVPGSARPQGISPTSTGHREGLIFQQVFYPFGHGFDFVLPIVDLARAVFHRKSLSIALVQCRDSDAPVRVDAPEGTAEGWGQYNVVTPYWVREA